MKNRIEMQGLSEDNHFFKDYVNIGDKRKLKMPFFAFFRRFDKNILLYAIEKLLPKCQSLHKMILLHQHIFVTA